MTDAEFVYLRHRFYERHLRPELQKSPVRPPGDKGQSKRALFEKSFRRAVLAPVGRRPASAPAGPVHERLTKWSYKATPRQLHDRDWRVPVGSIYSQCSPYPGPGHYGRDRDLERTLKSGPLMSNSADGEFFVISDRGPRNATPRQAGFRSASAAAAVALRKSSASKNDGDTPRAQAQAQPQPGAPPAPLQASAT
eukprot:CAMPEP_0117587920 /NCGR_PEP_ID=MMETSP0784-20121206/69567_1 /TAXON_ID=39447 /ORGANISM="" /LENGTH=194 /DNA_ID=CAMNT_0005389229 /DNA_START=44 /DNA_END=629 /DNA_ORIENTATION=-